MNFEIAFVSRGHILLKSEDEYVRVLGEALIASAPTEPCYVIYLNSLNNWESSPDVALTENEKREVISTIRENFQAHGLIVDFES